MSRQSTSPTRAPAFRELRPPPALATHADRIWVRITGEDPVELRPRIVPDGCIDIVVLGDAAPIVVGPATRAVHALLPPHCVSIGIRFRPGMAPSLLGVPASELLDATLPLRAVWGRLAAQLSENVAELSTVTAKVVTLEAGVIGRLVDAPDADRIVAGAATWLARHPAARVQDLSRALDLSDRQLRRRFDDGVGFGPKTLHRILRFQRWLRLARQTSGGPLRLAEVAAAAGYSDQAHMTREVSRLAGVSPTALLHERRSTEPQSEPLPVRRIGNPNAGRRDPIPAGPGRG
jgi:AraC-like DNA-binding protein